MRDFKNMKRQRGRNRGGGGAVGGRPQQNANRAFDSNGPDNIKIRGHAQHVFEKYQQLARDAFSSGDRVLAENYLQHADHYFRVLRTIQPQRPASEILGRDVMASGLDIDFEEEFEAQPEEAASESAEGGDAPSAGEAREGGGRSDDGRQDRYDNNRSDQGGWRDRQNNDRQANDRQTNDRQTNDRQTNDRQGGDRYDRQSRDRNYGDRQGGDRQGGDRQDRYDRQGGDRQSYNRQGYDQQQAYDRQGGDRQGGERQGGGERSGYDRQDRSDRQDRFEGRRDNRRFEGQGRRDERDFSRDNRDNRYEARSEEPRRDTRDTSETNTPRAAAEPQPDYEAAAPVAAETTERGSVLRAQDGAVSEAPAFLQASGGDGEEARPRVRRRRAPRTFRAGEGEDAPSDAAPSDAPTSEPA